MNTKAGYVTVIGRPNAGKSTLTNALLGEKLSIITNKPQTTRKRVMGILTEEEYQIIFLDTPGILDPGYLLQSKMMDHVHVSVRDADVLLVLIDIADDPDGKKTLKDQTVINVLKDDARKKVLIINKVDLVRPEIVEELALREKKNKMFDRIIGCSAIMNFNVNQVLESILEFLPEHPKFFPDDQLTDENERFFVSEIIREKILEQYRDEVPYSVEILVDEFKERNKGKDFISASIVVEKDSQKAIIIGKKGEAIKKLGELARNGIDEFLQRPVYLELRVKVKAGWRQDEQQLKRFGYQQGDKE